MQTSKIDSRQFFCSFVRLQPGDHREFEKKVNPNVLLTSFPYGVLLVVTAQKIYGDAIEMFPYCIDCNLQYTGVSLLNDTFYFFIVQ